VSAFLPLRAQRTPRNQYGAGGSLEGLAQGWGRLGAAEARDVIARLLLLRPETRQEAPPRNGFACRSKEGEGWELGGVRAFHESSLVRLTFRETAESGDPRRGYRVLGQSLRSGGLPAANVAAGLVREGFSQPRPGHPGPCGDDSQ